MTEAVQTLKRQRVRMILVNLAYFMVLLLLGVLLFLQNDAAGVTGYLLVALFPLVPGGGIYYTMEYCIAGNTQMFLETGLHTLGIAGALALGILLVSSLNRLFGMPRRNKNNR